MILAVLCFDHCRYQEKLLALHHRFICKKSDCELRRPRMYHGDPALVDISARSFAILIEAACIKIFVITDPSENERGCIYI